jgi:hypothetical protein
MAASVALDRVALKKSFSRVPVGLKLLGGPINTGSPDIFQMNIQQTRRFGEYFQIWPGAANNEIEVLSTDSSLLQLVLRVKEPRRSYMEVVPKASFTSVEQMLQRVRSAEGRILDETRHDWRLELWTPQVDRRYLCGRDDIHLFIAQVGSGDTVAQAHEALKPPLVRRTEQTLPGSIQRQGEWFFIPVSDEGLQLLELHLQEWPRALRTRTPVGPGGRPHIADAVVSIDRRVRSGHREYRRPEVYARGVVTHPDHRDLYLDGWRRVVRNAELGGANERLRISWID